MGRRETFATFAEAQNNRAPFDQLLHGVRGTDFLAEDTVGLARDRLAADLGEWISTVGEEHPIDEPTRLALRDVLSARLLPRLVDQRPGASSMLDLVTTGATSESRIRHTFEGYGIDLETPQGVTYADDIFREAAGFFDAYVAGEDSGFRVLPPVLRNLRSKPDPRVIFQIFKTAAGVEGTRMQVPYACALLRIALVIDLARTHPRIQAMSEVHQSMEYRLREHITRPPGGSLLFKTRPGDPGIRLVDFSLRNKHPFSIYAKLLHKPETSVSEIQDLIGCLFNAYNPQDTLKLVYALFFDPDDAVFSPYLIDPPNSDQMLFDPDLLQAALVDPEQARAVVMRMGDTVSLEDAPRSVRDLFGTPGSSETLNPHTARNYHILRFISAMRTERAPRKDPALHGLRARKAKFPLASATMVPVEFTFGDRETLLMNEALAPHSGYKDRQKKEVVRRLGANNLDTAFAAHQARQRR